MARRATWLLALISAIGCNVDLDTGTLGTEERVRFVRSCSNIFGCSIDRPLARAASVELSLRAVEDELPPLSTSSSTPDAASVFSAVATCRATACDRSSSSPACVVQTLPLSEGCGPDMRLRRASVSVRGEGAGNAMLQLRTLDGELFDQVLIQVRDVEHLRIECHSSPTDPLELAVGERCPVAYSARDARGAPLIIGSSATLSVTDKNVIALSSLFGPTASVQSAQLGPRYLMAMGTGSAQIAITLGTQTAETPVVVVGK